MNKEELQAKIQNVNFYTGEQYELCLYSNGDAFMANKNKVGEQNTQIFKTLDIEDIYTFCAYFYNVEKTSELWPVFYPKDGDYEPFYNLVMELLFRSYLKSKNLPYNFNKCKNGDKLTIKEALTPYLLKYIIKDNRCLLDSVLENDELRQLKQMFYPSISEDCFLGGVKNIEFEKNMEEKQDKPLFKVGDIVRIRKRRDRPEMYPLAFTNFMTKYENSIAVITNVEENNYKPEDYSIKGDGARYDIAFIDGSDIEPHEGPQQINDYVWSSPMLEKVNTNKETIFQIGDIVEVLDRKYFSGAYPMAYADEMLAYKGQFAVIKQVTRGQYEKEDFILKGDGAVYQLRFLNQQYSDGDRYNWSSPMLKKENSALLTASTPLTSGQNIITYDMATEATDVKTTVCIDKPLIQIVKHKINFKIKNPI